jgi:hypothetical protein
LALLSGALQELLAHAGTDLLEARRVDKSSD